jgi:transcription elongation factor GreA
VPGRLAPAAFDFQECSKVDMKKVPVTREGLERLKAELEELRTVKRPQIAAIVAEARSHGDLRENAAYDAARHDQMMNEKRISDIEALVRSAHIIEDDRETAAGVVGLGSTVVVDFEGDEERYTIVGAIEAKPARGLISNESPIGRALLGKRPGQTAKVATPGGMSTITILRIE